MPDPLDPVGAAAWLGAGLAALRLLMYAARRALDGVRRIAGFDLEVKTHRERLRERLYDAQARTKVARRRLDESTVTTDDVQPSPATAAVRQGLGLEPAISRTTQAGSVR
jgi:hypothetical protein